MNPGMDCREARAHAPLFVGEDLESDALDAVRGHLEACAECAAQVAALERALRAFEVERVRVDPRVDLWSNIERELAQSGHLRPAQPASPSLASSSVASVAASATGDATRAPSPLPRRTLAGARRWFAVAAAAAVAAFVLNAWLAREAGRSGSPDDVLPGPDRAGSLVVRNAPPTLSSPSGSSVGAQNASVAAPATLVADVSNSAGASAGQGVRLAAGPASAPSDVASGAAPAASSAPGSAPAPGRYDGLRRVNGDEALLRDSLNWWSAPSRQGSYSLVADPVRR